MVNCWVVDYETMINCFVAVFQHYKDSDDLRVFVIHKERNDFAELKSFLYEHQRNLDWHISYNGLAFDAHITKHLLSNKDYHFIEPERIAHSIYLLAQNLIVSEDDIKNKEYLDKVFGIKQLDLYKLNHWDNAAKRSSLKWIQYSMDWFNIQEMPIHHSTRIDSINDVDSVIQYCINDVKSTKQIYDLSKELIRLRQNLSKLYSINLMNASEPRISKDLFSLFLSNKIKMNRWDILKMRTIRDKINVGSIILPYVKFKTPEFKSILNKFKSLVIDVNNTKGGFKHSITYKDVKTDFGLGGVHGATKSGIYEAKDGMIIMTSDVTSFYPNLAIRNGWAPAHLPKQDFCDQYEWFFEERKKIPKKDPLNYVYKIILNSTYGLSNDKNAFLYDPEFTMRITINGQLSLAMLYEMICTEIPGCIPLMQNTDGLETMIPAHYKDKYFEICKEWETITNLQLEHDEYKKIILADVNNYIAVHKTKECSEEEFKKLSKECSHYVLNSSNGRYFYNSTKCKGRFEFLDLALHKNKSFLVIPQAVYYYFVHDVLPEHYVNKNRNIMDYCGGIKAKGDWIFIETCNVRGLKLERELQKIVRYYVSNNGCKIIKKNTTDGREIQTEAGKWLQTEYNLHVDKPWEEYNINTAYYLENIYKEIDNINNPKPSIQLSLF